MRLFLAHACLVVLAAAVLAGPLTVTPSVQAELDRLTAEISQWARAPLLIQACLEQNRKGPIAGLDNWKWHKLPASDPIVKGLLGHPASAYLRQALARHPGVLTEAFLSGRQGEKVAFATKPSRYLHRGMKKFDVPLRSRRPWQGEPELDGSTRQAQLQLAVPLLHQNRVVGVLVVGVSLTHLKAFEKR